MRYLKKFESNLGNQFQSEEYKKWKSMVYECEDILIELRDNNISFDVYPKFFSNPKTIIIEIYKDGDHELFKYSDLKLNIEHLLSFMVVENKFQISEIKTMDSKYFGYYYNMEYLLYENIDYDMCLFKLTFTIPTHQ